MSDDEAIGQLNALISDWWSAEMEGSAFALYELKELAKTALTVAYKMREARLLNDVTIGEIPAERERHLAALATFDEWAELLSPGRTRDRMVIECRELGATWAQIGKALGVSAQAAYKKAYQTLRPIEEPGHDAPSGERVGDDS